MKIHSLIKIKKLVTGLCILLISFGCSDWIDDDLNIDPDSPSDVPMNLLLPAIQLNMGYNLLGNNTVRTNNIWTQHFDGVARQSFTEGRYQLTPADVNNVWSSIYSEMLMNLRIIIAKSENEGEESPNFKGVAQVLQATTLGITTDLFGDIPFSQAFQGAESIFISEYDTQESIYNSIFSMLDDAVINLNNPENVFALSGDVSYDGDVGKWIKAAHSIKARHYLQLSNVMGNEAYSRALEAVSGGFTSNDDDLMIPFEDANRNPIFQFMEQRGDIRMSATFVNMLTANDDPRLPFYVAQNNDEAYVGSDPGSQNDSASEPGPYVASPASPTMLMSYSELKFIEAEARLALGQDGAQEAYEEAVAASVLRVTGEANTEWLGNNINGDPVTLEKIIKQKYIDGFATNQPYADYRRTGLPELNVPPGAVLPAMPTRFPYAQSELDYNRENVPSAQISDKLWWDQ